eukprot:TRINITY_DN8265_c0_g1_i1.p1 TRINITY_DN8265_c0_g1~~TRINITY_DN8265_c0_g1_i1.p1  ORF type:complete len:356 (+),score=54.28 TRINITY_DN8265_c0_g1_i1:422-1489(+)
MQIWPSTHKYSKRNGRSTKKLRRTWSQRNRISTSWKAVMLQRKRRWMLRVVSMLIKPNRWKMPSVSLKRYVSASCAFSPRSSEGVCTQPPQQTVLAPSNASAVLSIACVASIARANGTDVDMHDLQDLDKFNRERTVIFHSNKPSCFDALQRLDESRAETVVNHLGQLVTCMQTSLDTSVQAANAAQATCQAFDKGADSTLFIQAIGSGLPLPPDVTIPEVLERNPKDGKRAPMSAVASASPKLQRANPPASQPAPAAQASTPATPAQAQSAPEQGSPKAGGGGPPPPPPKPKPAAAGPPQVRMLYDFAGTNDGELPSSANEMVFLMQDDGSGWALVAKSDGTQGYIPSSYYQRV